MNVEMRFEEILENREIRNVYVTDSSIKQEDIEIKVQEIFEAFLFKDKKWPVFRLAQHRSFLNSCLKLFSKSYERLDSSRVWLCYWILHSDSLIHNLPDADLCCDIISFLKLCQKESGGFAGNPHEIAQLAPTYAAINTLCILERKDAYDSIDRVKLKEFLWSVKQSDGSFAMHIGGECDVRGVYCALSVAKLTNIFSDDLFENTLQYVLSCQTYEGGFAGNPDLEAHGGYTFCGIASLFLLQKANMCDSKTLMKWLVNKQKTIEGGFCGRTNKLVDSCYSFWVGASLVLAHRILENETNTVSKELLYNEEALQEYLLICCQYLQGGMADKPDLLPDIYHTCYSLSGLSLSQQTSQQEHLLLNNNEFQFRVMTRAKDYFIHKNMHRKNQYTFVSEMLKKFVGMGLNKVFLKALSTSSLFLKCLCSEKLASSALKAFQYFQNEPN